MSIATLIEWHTSVAPPLRCVSLLSAATYTAETPRIAPIRADASVVTRPHSSSLVQGRVLEAITSSSYDFRTPASIATELKLGEDEVRDALESLGDQVRRPVGGGDQYTDWYRATSRGLTWRERWWLFRAGAGHIAPGV
jgi:hypothetical protein